MSVILPLLLSVCVYPCWDSPWLNQASYTFTSSDLHRSLSLLLWKDWWAAWLPFILPDFLTEQREKGKNEESGVCPPSLIPLYLGSVKKTWCAGSDK